MLTRITALKNELNTFQPFGPKLLPHIRDYYRVALTYVSIREAQVSEKETAYMRLMYQGEIETQREMLRMLQGTE